jgi:hypothetical protein
MFLLSVSLALSVFFLFLADWAFRRSRRPAVYIGICSVILPLVPMAVMSQSHVVFFQGVILTALAVFAPRDRPWRFLGLAAIGTVAAYGIAATIAFLEVRSLRARFPVESLEARLPKLPPTKAIPVDSPSTADIEQSEDWVAGNWRGGKTLNDLHENAVEIFLSRAGFGVSRLYMGIDRAFSDNSPIDPERSTTEAIRTTSSRRMTMAPIEFTGEPGRLHRDLLPEFFRNGDGFGHFRDRTHVIGFRPHGFDGWRPFAPQIRKIQLVGLVVHPEPVVYLSGEMPTMANLATIPLRPLDEFEKAGLAALREGEALYTRKTSLELRMLGPIRASKTCVECHDCERGRLLGAFSYHLE